ncbi:hypothetical protein LguiA_036278 [Lonicera macranthoides]
MEQCRQGKSAKWIRNLGKRIALRAGHGGPSPEPVGCRWTARAAPAARAGRRVPAGGRTGNGSFGGLPRASNSRLRTGTDKGNPTCSECQSEEIQPSAAKPQPRERAWQKSAGKEDPVELDSSPTL